MKIRNINVPNELISITKKEDHNNIIFNKDYIYLNNILINTKEGCIINISIIDDREILNMYSKNQSILMIDITNKFINLMMIHDEIFIDIEDLESDQINEDLESDQINEDTEYPLLYLNINEMSKDCIQSTIEYRTSKDDYDRKIIYNKSFNNFNDAIEITANIFNKFNKNLKKLLEVDLQNNYIINAGLLYEYIGTGELSEYLLFNINNNTCEKIHIYDILEDFNKYVFLDKELTIIHGNRIFKSNDKTNYLFEESPFYIFNIIYNDLCNSYEYYKENNKSIIELCNKCLDLLDNIYENNMYSKYLDKGIVFIFQGVVYKYNNYILDKTKEGIYNILINKEE